MTLNILRQSIIILSVQLWSKLRTKLFLPTNYAVRATYEISAFVYSINIITNVRTVRKFGFCYFSYVKLYNIMHVFHLSFLNNQIHTLAISYIVPVTSLIEIHNVIVIKLIVGQRLSVEQPKKKNHNAKTPFTPLQSVGKEPKWVVEIIIRVRCILM